MPQTSKAPAVKPSAVKRPLRKRLPLALMLAVAVVVAGGGAAALVAAPKPGDLALQKPKWKIDRIPDAPPLSPEEELKTFRVPPGFRVELVAAEPMTEVPIAMAFDPDGRICVVELRAYMPTVDGKGELEPLGRINRLEDTDGDGRMDRSTVFMDKLVVPRAVGLAGDGVLVSEPPNLYLARDTDGDGRADKKDLLLSDYASRNPNPEHMANGLVWMLDNWCYSANWGTRFRWTGGAAGSAGAKLVREGTASRGQWGISQDDQGRLFYNANSAMLRADAVPAQYLTRNPYVANPAGVNMSAAGNGVAPARVNPGVNRGYTDVVGPDGKLRNVTAACGPQIYRGDAYPPGFRGNAFVCEPSGNLIARHVLEQKDLAISGKSARIPAAGKGEVDFFTSTDERFRPVSLYNGPDGCLYVVDMYHGILQHRAYLTAYLDDQIKQRDLDKGNNVRGRIWRIVPENFKRPAAPKLSKASGTELVTALSHPNGWWRDTAQRLLVERADAKVVPALERIALGKDPAATPLARLHALWTLQGMDRLEDETAAALVKDADANVRVQALRAADLMIRKKAAPNVAAALPSMLSDSDLAVQVQLLSLATPDMPELQAGAPKIIAKQIANPVVRSAALSGAAGRELELLQALLAEPAFAGAAPGGKRDLFNDLAECVVRGRSAERIDKLFALIAAMPAAQKIDRLAMVQGVAEAVAPDRKSKVPPRKLRLPHEPAGLAKLKADGDGKVVELAGKIDEGLSWPNKPGDTTPPLRPLTSEQATRFEKGRELYTQLCAVCHQPSGLGMDGVAPPLVDSEWVVGSPERTTRIVLHGVAGPIKVGRKQFDGEMPGLKALDDEQIAGVLTYVRREWGHEAAPVDPTAVAKTRKATADRGDQQWTAEELQKVK